MRFSASIRFFLTAAVLLLPLFARAQQKDEPRDSLVRLIRARSLLAEDKEGATCRKVFGVPEDQVTFLHNDTYLLCDTAYWYVDSRVINAFGHVKILQEGTQLTSDKLTYLIDDDLAQFRGSLVQLQDSRGNVLRTSHLDYNTRDSLAVFETGGALRDRQGQLIESDRGTYDAKAKLFTFREDVNMFTDSVFIKTTAIDYESERDFATFGNGTDMWKEEDMLSAEAGWYDRRDSLFFFRDRVHMMNDDQEGWCDSLYYFRGNGNLHLLGDVQVSDTTRNTFSVAGEMFYVEARSQITLWDDPAVMMIVQQKDERPDSLWFGADTMIYHTVPRYALQEEQIAASKARLDGINVDPVGELRKKAAEAKAEKAAQAAAEDPNSAEAAAKRREAYLAEKARKKAVRDSLAALAKLPQAVRDSLERAAQNLDVPPDTLLPPPPARDSLAVGADSLSAGRPLPPSPSGDALPDEGKPLEERPSESDAPKDGEVSNLKDGEAAAATDTLAVKGPPDSTRIGFLTALRNVRMYRRTMQISCDSLEYNDIDSLARLYKEPLIWNETNHQYSADSVYALIRNGGMEKANLMSDSFILIREDSIHFDQIKATESVAWFKENKLARYDGLGGVDAVFFIEEKGTLATVNTKETKMLSALFRDDSIERVYYFDSPKSNAYPLCQLSLDDQRLKGFNWDESKRSRSRNDVTVLPFRSTQRRDYEAHPRAQYPHSARFFPGYIDNIYRLIAIGDSLEVVRAHQKAIRDSLNRVALRDSLAAAVRRDSLHRADSLLQARHLADSLSRVDSLFKVDSIARVDSIAKVSDSLKAVAATVAAARPLTKEEIRQQKEAERKAQQQERKRKAEEKRQQRQAAKEARWAKLDRRDSLKAARKVEKAKERERKRKLQQLEQQRKLQEREERRIQQLMERELRKRKKQQK
ncbi:MAG: hypothetical protein J6Y32_07365 [Bacteroidales bacterium]|nr:hypothetical protein [Bacteroidales bacterium]